MNVPRDNPILAWHFTKGDGTLRDGRSVVIGKWLDTFKNCNTGRWVKRTQMCAYGLHASVKPLDTLNYAPGPRVYRVECAGAITHQDDKLVCTARRPLWGADADSTLREFARLCAKDVLHLWNAPSVVVQYLDGRDESLRAAAWDAAKAAARDAAWDAARDAARDAAWAAAWAAAKAAQNQRLSSMLLSLGPKP